MPVPGVQRQSELHSPAERMAWFGGVRQLTGGRLELPGQVEGRLWADAPPMGRFSVRKVVRRTMQADWICILYEW